MESSFFCACGASQLVAHVQGDDIEVENKGAMGMLIFEAHQCFIDF